MSIPRLRALYQEIRAWPMVGSGGQMPEKRPDVEGGSKKNSTVRGSRGKGSEQVLIGRIRHQIQRDGCRTSYHLSTTPPRPLHEECVSMAVQE